MVKVSLLKIDRYKAASLEIPEELSEFFWRYRDIVDKAPVTKGQSQETKEATCLCLSVLHHAMLDQQAKGNTKTAARFAKDIAQTLARFEKLGKKEKEGLNPDTQLSETDIKGIEWIVKQRANNATTNPRAKKTG